MVGLFAAATAIAAQPATSAKTATSDEAIQLNPFVVESDPTDSYSALNTTSITRFRTDLKIMPITADVFTKSFMKDIGATDVESMLAEYSPAGFGGSNPTASGQGLGRPGDYNGQSSLVLRGVATGASMIRRNGFLPHWGGSDNFFMERVEVIRGPQSLLFGDGGAGGVGRSSPTAAPNRACLATRGGRYVTKTQFLGSHLRLT